MLDRSVLKRPGEWLRAIRRGKIFIFLSSLSLFGLFPIPFSPSGHSVVALTTLETPVFHCAGAKVRHVIGTAAGVFLPRDAPFSSLAALPAVFSRTDSIILDGYADIRSPQLPPPTPDVERGRREHAIEIHEDRAEQCKSHGT